MCEELIVVGGLPCSGKTFLISSVLERKDPCLRWLIGDREVADLEAVDGQSLRSGTTPDAECVFVHLDLTAQDWWDEPSFKEMLARSNRVRFVTVMVPARRLRARHNLRAFAFLKSLRFAETWYRGDLLKRALRHSWLFRSYRKPGWIHKEYRNWVAQTLSHDSEHWVIDGSDEEFRAFRVSHEDELGQYSKS